jgi:CHAT domain-containing protein
MLVSTTSVADPPPLQIGLQQTIAQRDERLASAMQHRAAGKLPEAIAEIETAWTIEQAQFGAAGQGGSLVHDRLIRWLLEAGRDADAAATLEKLCAELQRQVPAPAWRIKECELTAEQIAAIRPWSAQQRAELKLSGELTARVLQAMQAGNLPESLTLAEQLQGLRERLWGKENAEYGLSLYSRGSLLRRAGRVAEARQALDASLSIWERRYGEMSRYSALSLSELSSLALDQNNPEQALAYATRAKQCLASSIGPQSGEYLSVLQVIEVAHRRRQDNSATIAAMKEQVALVKNWRGEQSAEYAELEFKLGNYLALIQLHDEAAATLERARKLFIGLEGDNGILGATVSSVLGKVNLRRGQGAPAAALLENSLIALERANQTSSQWYVDGLIELAQYYKNQREFARAERLLDRAEPRAIEIFGEKHFMSAHIAYMKGEVLEDQGKSAEAINSLQRAVERSMTPQNEPSTESVSYLRRIASVASSQNNHEQAEIALSQAIQGAKSLGAERTENQISDLIRLGIFQRLLRKLPAAANTFAEAAQLAERVVGRQRFLYGQAQYLYGETLRLSGEIPAAQKPLQEAVLVLESAADRDDKYLAWARQELGALYYANKDFAAADAQFAAAQPLMHKIFGPDDAQSADLEWKWGQTLVRGDKTSEVAAKIFQTLLPKYERLGDWTQAALTAEQLCFLQINRSDIPGAIQSANKAAALLEQHEPTNPRILSPLLVAGTLYGQLDRLAEADSTYSKALSISEKIGKKDFNHAAILSGLAGIQARLKQQGAAENSYRQALAVLESLPNRDENYTATTRLGLASVLLNIGKTEAALELLQTNLTVAATQDKDSWRALVLLTLRNIKRAHLGQSNYKKVVEIEEEIIRRLSETGPRSLEIAEELSQLGNALRVLGNAAEALTAYKSSADIYKELAGSQSERYAEALLTWAHAEVDFQHYEQASALLLATEPIAAQLGEEGDLVRASILEVRAEIYDSVGDAVRSESTREQSVALLQKRLGERDVRTLGALSVLAANYTQHGNLTKAERVARQVLALRQEIDGPTSQQAALAMSNLANIYAAPRTFPNALTEERKKQLQEALTLEQKAGEIMAQTVGRTSGNFASHLSRLAFIHSQNREPAEVYRGREQAAELYRQLGMNGLVISELTSAAYSAMEDKNFDRAADFANRAADFAAERFGRQHDNYLMSLKVLMFVALMKQDLPKVNKLQRELLDADRQALLNASGSISERQQLELNQKLRGWLDFCLSMQSALTDHGTPAEDTYDYVLTAKGSLFRRQRSLVKAGLDSRLQPRVARLDAISAELAALALAANGVTGQERQQHLQKLIQEREQIESDLASQSEAFRTERSASRVTPRELMRTLPAGVVLIDILEYQRFKFEEFTAVDLAKPSDAMFAKVVEAFHRHLTAFVIRNDRIERVELGTVDEVDAVLSKWSPHNPGHVSGRRQAAAHQLKQLVWQPLEQVLTPAEETVLISTDGIAARIPFAALPGKTPGTALLDERLIALVPVPQLLPAVWARPVKGISDSDKLLLVGDVDFQNAVGYMPSSATAANNQESPNGLPRFDALPGSQAEVQQIVQLWPRKNVPESYKILRGDGATELTFRETASTATFLHLATHGYLAPQPETTAVASLTKFMNAFLGGSSFGVQSHAPTSSISMNPAAHCVLALAGANRRPSAEAGPSKNDGVLTALDLAVLPLDQTRLVVLSACDTAQGKSADGEGVLGMQRAFQAAGAESVIGTLWKISDSASQQLMVRFYQNLWQKRMGRAEALREAQQWLRREAISNPKILAANEGDVVEPPIEGEELSPFWWAALTLSGDWR